MGLLEKFSGSACSNLKHQRWLGARCNKNYVYNLLIVNPLSLLVLNYNFLCDLYLLNLFMFKLVLFGFHDIVRLWGTAGFESHVEFVSVSNWRGRRVTLGAPHALLHSLCCKDGCLTRLPFLWHFGGDQVLFP